MGEFVGVFFHVALGMQVFGVACVWVGWLLGRDGVPVDPAEAFEDLDEEPEEDTKPVVMPQLARWFTAEPAVEPEPEPVTASLPKDFGTGMWPVTKKSRLDPLEDETVRVTLAGVRVQGKPAGKAPYAWLTRHSDPDKDRACLTRTQEMGRVSG